MNNKNDLIIAIDIHSFSKSFKEVCAVKKIYLTVNKGEMFGIVGPDGAGKTTLIRMLCGIIDPDEGQGIILGYDYKMEREAIKKHIGYLSQRFSLYGDLTIDENIEFFAEIHQVKNYKKRRDELLAFTRLTQFRKRLSSKLSGGMKQKLALACTLIHTPDIIFLDEPTTGVDPVSRRDFWKILFSLLKDGITIVMSTPYLDEAERCTKIGMMNEGQFLIVDSLSAIKKEMKGFVIEIVCNHIREAYKMLSKLSYISEAQTFGDRLNVVIKKERDQKIIRDHLMKHEIKVQDMRVISPSLENVFISLVKSKNNHAEYSNE